MERAQEAMQSYQQSYGTGEIRTEGQGLPDRRPLRNASSSQLDPPEEPKPRERTRNRPAQIKTEMSHEAAQPDWVTVIYSDSILREARRGRSLLEKNITFQSFDTLHFF